MAPKGTTSTDERFLSVKIHNQRIGNGSYGFRGAILKVLHPFDKTRGMLGVPRKIGLSSLKNVSSDVTLY